MVFVVMLVVSAISSGCLYGMVGMSLATIYNATNVINFAQGDLVMLGAMSAYALVGLAKLGFIPSMIAAGMIVALVGLVIIKCVVGPHLNRGTAPFPMIISLMGVSIIIAQLVVLTNGPVGHHVPYAFGVETLRFGGVTIQPHHFLVIGVTALTTIGYWLLMNRTLLGMATRAVGFNRDMAYLTGIKVSTIVLFSFMLSAGMCGLAGALVAPFTGARPLMGASLIFKGFMALVVGGGFGKPYGALLGGVCIAAISTFLTGLGYSEFGEAAVFLVMLLVIIWRPTGLMAEVQVS